MLLKNIYGMKYFGAAVMLSVCCLFTPSATAASQSDIQSCRAAIVDQGLYDISKHRLRYVSQKGNRTRTLKLVAIPNGDGDRFELTCRLNFKNKVVAINDHALTKLVKS